MDLKAFASQAAADVRAVPPVRRFLAVRAVYSAASGGLVASGLAYGALIAALTGLLASVGLMGYLVPHVREREQLVAQFTGNFASLAPAVRSGLEKVAAHPAEFALAGIVALTWSTYQFYGSVDGAVARIFPRAPARGAIAQVLRGVASTVLLIVAVLAGILTRSVAAVTAAGPSTEPSGLLHDVLTGVAFSLVTVVAVVLAVGVLYRVLPNVHVPVSVLRRPALLTGLVLAALTELFVFLAPMLVGQLSVFGGFAAVLAALAWLALVFRVILLGAAWISLRLEEAERSGVAPAIAIP